MARLASAGTAMLPGTGGAAGLAAEATAAAGGAAILTTMSISGNPVVCDSVRQTQDRGSKRAP